MREWVTLFVWLAGCVCVCVSVAGGSSTSSPFFCFYQNWQEKNVSWLFDRSMPLIKTLGVCVQPLVSVRVCVSPSFWGEDWKLKLKTGLKIEFVHPSVSTRAAEGKKVWRFFGYLCKKLQYCRNKIYLSAVRGKSDLTLKMTLWDFILSYCLHYFCFPLSSFVPKQQ